ncbi:hypothetical protein [Bacillus sp. FJAT-29937]|uniref:hypothetical protein n=1 Tax=Bacillus sp. FJAT-29937 TaxID=1720553 RepID=UPI00082A2353|nr:hypothetical protein [Bacillus sp. FJAT-29937]
MVKSNKKYQFYSIVILLILMFITTIYCVYSIVTSDSNVTHAQLDNSIESKNLSNQQDKKTDLYAVSYAMNSKKILGDLGEDEKNNLILQIEKDNLEELIDINYRGTLYDLWLYIKLCEELEMQPKYGDEISKILEKLWNNEGFYKAYKDETIKQPAPSFLLSTKMALDIYESINIPIPSLDVTKNWVKGVFKSVEADSNYDFISKGSFLVLINEIDILISDENILPKEKYEVLKGELVSLFEDSEDSVEKFKVGLQINELYNDEIIILETENIKDYLYNIQLPNGAFPMFGKGQPDILSTSISLSIMNDLSIEILNKDALITYLDQVVQSGLTSGINKN